MRVLLITDSYPPEIRSASLLMAEMAEGFRDRGCEVCVLTSSPRYNLAQWPLAGRKRLFYRETADGIEVIRAHTLPIHNVGHLRRGLGQIFLPAIFTLPTPALKRPDATVVYSPPLTLGLAAWAIKVGRGAPFIFNVQDIFPQNAVDLGALRNPRIIAAFRAIERFVYRHADAVTVHSNANRNVLIESGADPAKISVIPNWVDAEKYERARGLPVPLADPSILRGKFVALFAGVMGYAQDFEVVIEAAKALRGDPDILFLLVGDGPRGAWVRREAALLPNVIVHPFIQGDDYPALLAAADCGLVTLEKSMKTPVVPSKILGYMAAGKPVVGSLNRESEAVAIIEDAGGGFARGVESGKDLAEKIALLRRDPELARKMGEAGRECVRRSFSPRACLDAYFELARSLRRPQ